MQVHLKFKLLGDAVRAFGENSMCGKVEKVLFEESKIKVGGCRVFWMKGRTYAIYQE